MAQSIDDVASVMHGPMYQSLILSIIEGTDDKSIFSCPDWSIKGINRDAVTMSSTQTLFPFFIVGALKLKFILATGWQETLFRSYNSSRMHLAV